MMKTHEELPQNVPAILLNFRFSVTIQWKQSEIRYARKCQRRIEKRSINEDSPTFPLAAMKERLARLTSQPRPSFMRVQSVNREIDGSITIAVRSRLSHKISTTRLFSRHHKTIPTTRALSKLSGSSRFAHVVTTLGRSQPGGSIITWN